MLDVWRACRVVAVKGADENPGMRELSRLSTLPPRTQHFSSSCVIESQHVFWGAECAPSHAEDSAEEILCAGKARAESFSTWLFQGSKTEGMTVGKAEFCQRPCSTYRRFCRLC